MANPGFFDTSSMAAMKKKMQTMIPTREEDNTPGFSVDEIATQLYMLPDKVQFCHHSTTSYAQHIALDRTYETIDDLKDEIIEKLIGYTGTRFSTLSLSPISGFGENMPMQVAKEIQDFGYRLYEWAEQMHYCDVENLAQSYSGAGAQLSYLLTLK